MISRIEFSNKFHIDQLGETVKKEIFILFCFLAFCVLSIQVWPQLTADELAERPKREEFLKTAEITGHSQIPDGVTRTIKLTLKKGETECSDCWKNPSPLAASLA